MKRTPDPPIRSRARSPPSAPIVPTDNYRTRKIGMTEGRSLVVTAGDHEGDPDGGGSAASDCRAIVVNGRRCVVRSEDVGFDQVVRLAFGGEEPTHARSMSVTYRRGPATAAEGILSHYQRIPLIDGEEFIVTRTDKS